MESKPANKPFIIIAALVVFAVAFFGGALSDRFVGIPILDRLVRRDDQDLGANRFDRKVLNEESIVIDVAERVSPSVVTVSAESPERRVLEYSPFGGFQSRIQGGEPQDIGTGFIVSEDGLIVTNKHVVSDLEVTYGVITKDGKEHEVTKISRDPSNDIAVLKINSSGLQPVELGDSGNLKVGQFAIAIGTALGEFRHTVTTGVVSGLGRGITAGSVFEGFVERLDDVIQTDAAINPGNSGGPLLNSAGQVIGVNVAVAAGAENVGFAIPINVVKDALEQFRKTGSFVSKPFLGVQYQMVDEATGQANDVPQGAYVVEVVSGSPAERAGIRPEDIITKFDGQDVRDDNGGLADMIANKKSGDSVSIEIWREGQTITVSANLSEFSE